MQPYIECGLINENNLMEAMKNAQGNVMEARNALVALIRMG